MDLTKLKVLEIGFSFKLGPTPLGNLWNFQKVLQNLFKKGQGFLKPLIGFPRGSKGPPGEIDLTYNLIKSWGNGPNT